MVQAAVCAQWQACSVPKLCCYSDQQGPTGQRWGQLPFSLVGTFAFCDASPVTWTWQGGGGSKHSIDPCDGSWQWHYLCYNCPKGCGLRELDLPYLLKLYSTPQKTGATVEGMQPFPYHLFLQGHLPLLSPEYRGIFQIEGNLTHISQACHICLNTCETSTLQPGHWSNEWCLLHDEMQVCG